jgi:hypothetical protein
MKKKKVFLTVFVLLTIFMFIGCERPDLGVYDKKVPADQLCTLEIAGSISVTSFNDKKVNWKLTFGKMTAKSEDQTVIKIPQGNHEMLVNFWTHDNWDTNASVSNVKITNNFIAGHTYRLIAILTIDGKQEETYSYKAKVLPTSVEFRIIDKGVTPKASE